MSTLTLVAAIPLSESAVQLWNPEIAHAAKVTANLFKRKSLHPSLLTRREKSYVRSGQPFTINAAKSEELINYTLTQRLSLDYPLWQSDRNSQSLLTSRRTQTVLTNQDTNSNQFFPLGHDLLLQNRPNSLEGTLRQQKYQIKKLELDLARERYEDGKISRGAFNQTVKDYQTALEEFKAFTHSSNKMAD
ncbi:MAG: hypothetical protein IGS48_11150 [Oscillatoriales cyanobacterium C42_A2020_001]|nr:hypothetical protein [Leptolyngbyaceae cyanobacterium C42_A2020_001]